MCSWVRVLVAGVTLGWLLRDSLCHHGNRLVPELTPPRDALDAETRTRSERLARINATVATPDPTNPADLTVEVIKDKLHR